MTTHRPNVIHDCKIDCTNPSEVMRILITKSDQLYLFWVPPYVCSKTTTISTRHTRHCSLRWKP